MSNELFTPAANARIDRRSEYYKTTETFKRRSAASKAKCAKYWADPKNHERVDTKWAKPVDVFDMQGRYIATYPSARKAARALFADADWNTENFIRRCRRGERKSYRGYQFRTATPDHADIEPWKHGHKAKGYHVNRAPDTYATKPVTADFGDGDLIRFESFKECAAALGVTYKAIHYAMKRGKTVRGWTIRHAEKGGAE